MDFGVFFYTQFKRKQSGKKETRRLLLRKRENSLIRGTSRKKKKKMVQVIPTHMKDAWDAWNIRGMILLSLTIQIILIILAPLRKRTPNRFLVMVLWLSYLLADWSANFAIGLISKNQGKESKPEDPPQNPKLMALWAPFLLLHLGGPDTITAYSLEDNALWHRHFLGLGLQAVSGAYVFIQSLPNTLWVIILLLFIAGTLKYLERTIALYLASSDKFRGSIIEKSESNSNETYRVEKEEEPLTGVIEIENPDKDLTHLEILQFAFRFFNNYKSLMVNNIFSSEQRDESSHFFSRLEHEEALRILEMELAFIYEGLYTKVSVLHTWLGAVTRTIALGSLLSAFFIFHNRHKKIHEFHAADIVITYTLFLAGIVLDLASVLMVIPSDWTFAVFSGSWNYTALNWFLGLKKPRWKKQNCCEGVEHEVLNTPFLLQRWSGSIKLFNFISYSVKADIKRIHEGKGRRRRCVWNAILGLFIYTNNIFSQLFERIAILNNRLHQYIIYYWPMHIVVIVEYWFMIPPYVFKFIDKYIINFFGSNDLPERFVHSEPLTKDLWVTIFTQLQRDKQERSKTNAESKGWASGNTELEVVELRGLISYIANVDYDRSLMVWHIATELCYQEVEASTRESHNKREFSKTISDYMMYLLIKQPKLMSDVAGIGKIRFRDTLAEAEKFFKRRHIENSSVKTASEEILSVSVDFDPRDFKGNRSKSVLFEAAALAKELKQIKKNRGEEHKWKIVSKVWMELLFHAACNCDATARMDQLSKGGELINFVWLAMAHLSLGDQVSSSPKETSKLKLL